MQVFQPKNYRAYAYKRDLKNLEFHLFDTRHFALEEDTRYDLRFSARRSANAAALTLVRPWRLPLGEDSLPLLYETLRER